MPQELTTDALIEYARAQAGKPLKTRAKKKPFTVAMLPDGIAFTPGSQSPRPNGRVMLNKYVAIFDVHRAFKTTPYVAAGLQDGSYFLSLVAGMLDEGLIGPPDDYSVALLAGTDGALERELASVLLRTTRRTRTRERNVEFVATYYGFRVDPSLSQVETGKRFGIQTRQRSLQVLEAFFLKKIQAGDLPSLPLIVDELEKHPVISSDAFLDRLRERGLIGKCPSDRDLLQDAGERCLGYQLYSTGFEEETREKYAESARRYFIRSDLVAPLRTIWDRLRATPSKNGFAEFGAILAEEGAVSEAQSTLLREFLLEYPAVRTVENASGLWYLFEDRVNPIISQLEKIHAVASNCPFEELVACLCNGIDPSPPADLVEAWARQTPLLNVWENQVSIREDTGVFELTQAENDVREFLLKPESRVTASPPLVQWMVGKGHPKPTADRIIFRSAFVYVDKSHGHGNYTFRLVGQPAAAKSGGDADSYFHFREKLKRAGREGTDRAIASTQRKEQAILQEWIFENRKANACAICHRTFHRSALRAAHKKPRFSCTPVERLDPNIVMPLCLLGCDFIYEEGFIVVSEGKVSQCAKDITPAIADYLKQVVDQRLPAEWLRGPASYFRLPGAARRAKPKRHENSLPEFVNELG
jgi:hypothetical protein